MPRFPDQGIGELTRQKRLEKTAFPEDANGIDAPLSISIAETLTPEEREELLQTVEALKSQANPDDTQSLEILKDAYWKLGQGEDGIRVTRLLADAYLHQGQFSAALLEYEGILLHQPDSPEITKIIAGLEATLNPHPKAEIALDFGEVEPQPEAPAQRQPAQVEPALIATDETRMPENAAVKKAAAAPQAPDANESLARFLIQYRMVSREAIDDALCHVRSINAKLQAYPDKPGVAAGLLGELIKNGADAGELLTTILDRTKFAYIPLEHYDIDRQIVKMLPESLTLGRRIVPFDLVSRTLFVAVDNPFDNSAKLIVQQSVDYHVLWHMATPATLDHILRETYRLQA